MVIKSLTQQVIFMFCPKKKSRTVTPFFDMIAFIFNPLPLHLHPLLGYHQVF